MSTSSWTANGNMSHAIDGRRPSSPVLLASVSGPLDDYPHEYFQTYGNAPYTVPSSEDEYAHEPLARPASRTDNSSQYRSTSGSSLAQHHVLNGVRSTSALLPPRQAGTVRDIASRFNNSEYIAGQSESLRAPPTQDRYRRPSSSLGGTGQKSSGGTDHARLHKRRPGRTKSPQQASSPQGSRSAQTSFDTVNSYSSGSTIISSKSQPHGGLSGKAFYGSTKPLFGEITPDGRFHGNFDLASYEQGHDPAQPSRTKIHSASRRQSESSLALRHGRGQPGQNSTSPTLSPLAKQRALQHRRSRSELDTSSEREVGPADPVHNPSSIPALYPTPPSSGVRNVMHKTSRIPVSTNRNGGSDTSSHSNPHSRPSSAQGSSPDWHPRISRSPAGMPVAAKENTTPRATSRTGRYQPPPISTAQTNQTLSAKIVAPLPKTSPPLRSSRPRQPVSSATTASTRAKAADRFQGTRPSDGRRPSEQWLGKPYDPKEHSRRKIPELEKVDFAARREKVKKAMLEHTAQSRAEEEYARSRSRASSKGRRRRSHTSDAGTEEPSGAGLLHNDVDRHQAEEMDRETDGMDVIHTPSLHSHARGLSLDTIIIPTRHHLEDDPMTAATEFEESPIIGRPELHDTTSQSSDRGTETPILLTSATYRPHSPDVETPVTESKGLLSSPMVENGRTRHMRSASPTSRDGTEFADDSPSVPVHDGLRDSVDRWGGDGHDTARNHGSIKIMFDEATMPIQNAGSSFTASQQSSSHVQPNSDDGTARAQAQAQHAHAVNSYLEPSVYKVEQREDNDEHASPREQKSQELTLQPTTFQPDDSDDSQLPQSTVAAALDQYESTGTFPPELLLQMDDHMVDLHRMSANGGSDAIMVQNLLDSIVAARSRKPTPLQQRDELRSDRYLPPAVTPDTPPDAGRTTGTAVVFRSGNGSPIAESSGGDEDDFEARIRKADEEWARQQQDEGVVVYNTSSNYAPPPPPKDQGYTPRSSIGPHEVVLPPHFHESFTTPTKSDSAQRQARAPDLAMRSSEDHHDFSTAPTPPPLPSLAPPAPPVLEAASEPRFSTPGPPQIPVSYTGRDPHEISPKTARNFVSTTSGSSRPSTDSQRAVTGPQLPGSMSMSSLAGSTRQNSIDAEGDAKLVTTPSPGPDQKRLSKRRHIIKELLDTENTYHQDLKIIEDIYKATVGDLVSAEDKKTLFGNCDEIERFSLHFYDDLRKAVHNVYIPPKQMRWANKRGSYSTTQSDGTGQTSMMAQSNSSNEPADDERDRTTTIGQTFLTNLAQMDQVYGTYLKNHDAANQRLSALKNTVGVKRWLEECHNNASDITSAWDLDSLLVKPTQRVSKYPMLLQQLLETTPADHPDHEALQAAAKDSVTMLTRINEAKKRADIVDSIINRKVKDGDVRSGLAKAFGRRTEKLKERVGIAEAFQDVEFDELAHKFGGHYIRLQICMRDVQDYLHRINKSMEQIQECAAALELYTDVSPSSLPEIESKWRRYGQAIREITNVAFPEHKAAVQKRVIDPMVACIKLHEGPQNAITQRKKRIVDFARCKSIEKRGEKPDKRTIEASEMYMALNDHLKMELPKLYSLTGSLVQAGLTCFLDIQLTWYNIWERKLRTTIDAIDIPASIQHIEPAFKADYEMIEMKLSQLSVCNGAILADSASFFSPSTTHVNDSDQSSSKRPSTFESKRTVSTGSELSQYRPALHKRHSSGNSPIYEASLRPTETRVRSNSSLSVRGVSGGQQQTSVPPMPSNRPWSNHGKAVTPATSFNSSRPTTANPAPSEPPSAPPSSRPSDEYYRNRPTSSNTFVTARPEQANNYRFSDMFHSALPPDTPSTRPATPNDARPELNVMFVCASLFEFSIDKTRKEGGYPYLTYTSGEVFDVIAQKGELWLAKNQDDSSNTLGWIWEQHFVILSGE